MGNLLEQGRKFTLSIVGIGCVMALTVAGVVLAAVKPNSATVAISLIPIAIGSIAGIVATFITGNSAVTFAFAKHQPASVSTASLPNAYTDDERGEYPNRELP